MKKIKVYSTPTCSWCVRLKEFLNNKNIVFDDIDVAVDQKAAQEMVEKSGQMGVPVMDIDGTVIVGFNEDAITKALDNQ